MNKKELTEVQQEELATLAGCANSLADLAETIEETGGMDGPEDVLLIPGLQCAAHLIRSLGHSRLVEWGVLPEESDDSVEYEDEDEPQVTDGSNVVSIH